MISFVHPNQSHIDQIVDERNVEHIALVDKEPDHVDSSQKSQQFADNEVEVCVVIQCQQFFYIIAGLRHPDRDEAKK